MKRTKKQIEKLVEKYADNYLRIPGDVKAIMTNMKNDLGKELYFTSDVFIEEIVEEEVEWFFNNA